MAVDAVTQGLLKDAQLSNPVIIVSSAAPVVNSDYTNYVDITALAVAVTSMTTGLSGSPVDGQTLTYRILDNGSARAITWGAKFENVAGAASGPVLPTTTVAGKRSTVSVRYDITTAKWGCTGNALEA